ncbi:20S-pre-rRNA D-site endonuclease NOB1 [Meyerozyma sp. JA9]|nr:20S-pre-rRNA D-site endonuclease NOB1 [Meyerozyma sp. JA9]
MSMAHEESKPGFEGHRTTPNIKALVLDAGPLITQPASSLQQHATTFFTTPGVHAELKDETVRQQLILWGDKLQIRHPKPEFIKKVVSFAKLTGDHAVLSLNDLHIIALAYELEVEYNKGDWRLRKYPGEVIERKRREDTKSTEKSENKTEDNQETSDPQEASKQETKKPESLETEKEESKQDIEAESTTPKKPRRRGGKKQRAKREAELQKELDAEEGASEPATLENDTSAPHQETEASPEVDETYDEEEDDGDWITPENLIQEMLKDNNEQVKETKERSGPFIKVALATGDFACQNVAMQIGLNLMNAMSGRQIKRVRNYMYRCHACFRLTPIPKDGRPKHFCPKCGGNTLLRCAVSIDNETGKVTPHLKANFQWIKRGNKFSLPSPLSKNQQKLQGNGGYQHNKQNRHKSLQNPLLLREDQKEYQQALKDDDWQRRQNEKMLQEWIGGGSADNYMSPFTTQQTIRPSGVQVGRGRYVNSSRRRK